MKKLFISKDLKELSQLPSFCQRNDIELIASSLIHFEPILFKTEYVYDVIFFSSIRSATFFLEQATIPSGIKIACIGDTTSKKLVKKGFNISFRGKKSGNPDEVGHEFLKWLGDRKVLIPCSKQSKRTIGSVIPSNQLQEIAVYQTLSDCKSITVCDFYVFTSPSNLESFLSCNPKPEGVIIAWGSTTKKAMLDKGIIPSITLENSNEEEVIHYLL